MIFDKTILDDLSAKAKENPCLHQALDLRTTPDDNSQRMLNALEPGTILPIHRHRHSSETMVIIRGKLEEYSYDDKGNLTDTIIMGYQILNAEIQGSILCYPYLVFKTGLLKNRPFLILTTLKP